jgi:hypothetical protein
MLLLSRATAIGLLIAALWPAMQAQDRTAEFRAKFLHETDAAQKAKLLSPLGDAEFQEIQKEAAAGNLDKALDILQHYRDEAEACQKALDASGRDPEKHPKGFKQLQISIRESLRRLDDLLVGFSGDEQKPFLEVRKDLERINRQIIHELFPRRPDGEPEPQKPKI